MPCKNGLLDYERVKYLNDNNITDTKEQLKVMHENGSNLSVISYSIIFHTSFPVASVSSSVTGS